MNATPETVICPNCSHTLQTTKTASLPDSQAVTCKACSQKFSLGQSRQLAPTKKQPAPPPTQPPPALQPAAPQIVYVQAAPKRSTKSRGVAIALAFFLGGFGAHHFYLDRPGLGVLYALFFWTFIPAFAALIEVIIMLTTSPAAWDAKYA